MNRWIDLAEESYNDLEIGTRVPRQFEYPDKFRIVEIHRSQQLKLGVSDDQTLLVLCRGTYTKGDWVRDAAAYTHLDLFVTQDVIAKVMNAQWKYKTRRTVIVGHSLGGWLGFNVHGAIDGPVESYLFEPFLPNALFFQRYHHGMTVFASKHDPVVNGLVGYALVHKATGLFHASRATWHVNQASEGTWDIRDMTKFVNHSLQQWREYRPDKVGPSQAIPQPDLWPDFVDPRPVPDDSTWPDFT